MKKSLIALAALAATGVYAQSSVTIDGQVSLGIVKTNGVASTLDSTNGTNQIRFRGTEDLGGGLKANFILAHRFSPESGREDGTAFGRPHFQGESTIGLSGSFGAVKLGRALTALQMSVNNTEPFGVSYLAGTGTLGTNYWTDISGNPDSAGQGRTDAITYASPSIGGLTVAASYGPKRSQGATQSKDFQSLWINYAAGPLTLGGGSEKARDGQGKVTAFTAIYSLPSVRLGVGVGEVTANMATAGFVALGDKLKTWNAMAIVPMGATTLKVGYGVAKNDTTNVDVNKKLGIGADYNLSKRTWLYATSFRDSARTAAGAKSGTEVGVRHTF